MKKLLALLLCLSLLALTACGAKPEAPAAEADTVRIASLKGPTSMGLVSLYDKADAGSLSYTAEYQICGAADEVSALLLADKLDMAAIPANLAAVLYQKTEGALAVAAVNTLGVLYIVETGDGIGSFADLAGRTIYSTGKGTTPEYALDYLLEQNGLDPETDVDIRFASEATEVAQLLAADTTGTAAAVLPQPYVAAALAQNSALRIALSFAEEWRAVSGGGELVTGVLVVRRAFAEENPELVAQFLADYADSVSFAQTDAAGAAALIERYGIVAKAAVAEQALPYCGLAFLAGDEMKAALSGYLQTLYDRDPASVGGTMPDDGFWLDA